MPLALDLTVKDDAETDLDDMEALRVAAHRVRALQSGSANLYLVYILAALLLMLVLA